MCTQKHSTQDDIGYNQEMTNWQDRTIRVFGEEAHAKIRNAKVCVFGLGGVGSFCLSTLARAGVENFLIVDGDEFDETNINRQEFAFQSTLGKRKVDVAEKFLLDINSNCKVEKRDEFILTDRISDTTKVVDDYEPDWVIDALDSISVKLLLAEHFVRDGHSEHFVSAMGAANKLDTSCIKMATLFTTVNDSLSRIMRKEARKRGIPDYPVCYSDEEVKLREGQAITRTGEKKVLGSVAFIPSIMGITVASHVLREIAER